MEFKYKPISNQKQIGKRRKLSDIKYLVIHDTGNTSKGADAEAHFKYLQTAIRYGSAHYYLDDREIIQTIGDSLVAWSIGDKWGYSNNPNRTKDALNSNSISVELCINADIDKAKAYKNLVELTKNLMKKFNISQDKVIRHFDATGKICPGSWSKNNWAKWWQFKEDIKKPIEWAIDLSKDSTFGNTEIKEKVGEQMQEEFKKAIELGITDGSRPKDPATREEVAMMVLRGIKIAKGEVLPNISKKPT
ncbi:N-acetylmuramoyl-L-alanine amidase family protein [Peptoniphilus sp. BV3C26]|uniref:peptidoglycan recognition protein family protein n=1 Tax=Peptoniphilus sp. BV3C26 TaxID=1111134 RepID=UPI0003B92324|nr:peptidoglycan recognition family protein [Peptoniphilus sp. BV3C26]ERT60645.1 N-acetylmuramoyl-L-alanine amidase [Peptoniphilus sp. BV3C26]